MYIAYDDITSRIAEEPIWWQFGVPRYEPFHPDIATIYSDELALVRSRCQVCHRLFDVLAGRTQISVRDQIVLYGKLSVGDPPRHDRGCGASMTSEQVWLLEYWHRPRDARGVPSLKWVRSPDLEGPLEEADDPTDAPKSLIERVRLAGLLPQYDDIGKSGGEGELRDVLTSAGIERPDYYARLNLALKRQNELKEVSRELMAFTRT